MPAIIRKENIIIRPFDLTDAEEISRLIVNNLLWVNVHDYGEAAVKQLARFYTPQLVSEYARNDQVMVAVGGSKIIGTASLSQDRVRNVFVRIDRHGQGVGKALMQRVEEMAREQGITRLHLTANFSAVAFYQKLKYIAVAESAESIGNAQIKMMVMEKFMRNEDE